MSEPKKPMPGDRFVFRPDVDPNDKPAVKDLAKDITAWVLAQRERVQRELREQRERDEARARKRQPASCPPAPAVPMAAKSK